MKSLSHFNTFCLLRRTIWLGDRNICFSTFPALLEPVANWGDQILQSPTFLNQLRIGFGAFAPNSIYSNRSTYYWVVFISCLLGCKLLQGKSNILFTHPTNINRVSSIYQSQFWALGIYQCKNKTKLPALMQVIV